MVIPSLNVPRTIDLYGEGDLKGLDIPVLGQYVAEKTSIPFRIPGNPTGGISGERTGVIAEAFARSRIKDLEKRVIPRVPFDAEVDYEKRRIADGRWKTIGLLYEGVAYQSILRAVLPEMDLLSRCSIVFTNQLFGTWDRNDRRYHARVSLYGFPNIISITGLVEAPAKPKEFYIKRQMGIPVEVLREEYRGRFLDHDDVNTTEVLKGYVMQALFFHLSGEPFCENRDCRLFNSHWQEEVLRSQMEGRYEFCPRHAAVLQGLKETLAGG